MDNESIKKSIQRLHGLEKLSAKLDIRINRLYNPLMGLSWIENHDVSSKAKCNNISIEDELAIICDTLYGMYDDTIKKIELIEQTFKTYSEYVQPLHSRSKKD